MIDYDIEDIEDYKLSLTHSPTREMIAPVITYNFISATYFLVIPYQSCISVITVSP